MGSGLLLLFGIVVIGFIVIILLLQRILRGRRDDQTMVLLQNQINEINKSLGENLASTHEAIQRQFSESSRIIREVTEKLTKLDETNKQVVGFAEQLQSLENVLT